MPRRIPTFKPLANLPRKTLTFRQRDSQAMYWGRWRRYSSQRLKDHPICVACEELGLCTPATITDHVVPHK